MQHRDLSECLTHPTGPKALRALSSQKYQQHTRLETATRSVVLPEARCRVCVSISHMQLGKR